MRLRYPFVLKSGPMRNQINFTKPPQDVFLNPAQDGGLFLLSPADYFWRSRPPALIQGFAASAYAEMNEKINGYLNVTRRHKTFSQAVEFNSVPMLLSQASFRKSFSVVRGKCLLSGASGARLLNRYIWENEDADNDPEELLVSYFQQCQSLNQNASIPLFNASPPDVLPIAIECRNTSNYYHFITESLSQLAVFADSGFRGPIYFHVPNAPDETKAFVRNFVTALFPDLVGRVRFERAAKDYELVLTTFDLSCAYYQFPPEIVGSIAQLAPSNAMFRGHEAYRGSQAVLSVNAFQSSLTALRNRGLQAIKMHDFSHLPKRFFVGCDDDQGRGRDRVGREHLCEMLQLFGFEYVVFENLSPLELVAIMANAEMMVSYHGAGFTNMIFAGAQTYVLEIGTLQTEVLRWGDSRRLAHAAGCRYISFFADFNQRDPLISPSFDIDGIVPAALSDQGVAEVTAFIVSVLGQLPDLPTPKSVQTLVDRLMAVREYGRALDLLEKHSHFVKNHVGLSLALADCHKFRDDPRLELSALRFAYEADKTRWQTLIRIIWCAKRCNLPDDISCALSRLRADFPDRYAVLTKNKSWVGQLD